MKKSVKRIMAYIYMPLFFSIIGISIVIIALSPYIKTAYSLMNIFTAAEEVEHGVDTDAPILVKPGENSNATIKLSEIKFPDIGEIYAKVYCNRIGLDAVIHYGDSPEILMNGLGQYANACLPGMGLPMLLAGHHSMDFYCLKDAVVGDVLTVNTTYGSFNYEIFDIKIEDSNNQKATKLDQSSEILTLYTCYPFTPLTSYTQRWFVYCKKISGPTLTY